jgi:hypothetical protein
MVQAECVEQNRIIENCHKNRADYSAVQEQIALIKEINREFQRLGIHEEAHMACEYVIALKDENWRNAIEAFLGIHRYAIIVSKEVFDVANTVLDRSKHRYVELVNTKRLMARQMDCEEDSVFQYLIIQNDTAANYFKFWLGRIHAVDIENIPDYDNAMSKEGKLSRNMAVGYINTRKIRSYCLGSQAIELNRKSAEKKLHELENNEREILLEQKSLRDKAVYLKAGLEYFKEFNLNSHSEWAKISVDLNDERGRYKDLLEAQKNNAEFTALNERVSVLENQLDAKKKERDGNVKQKATLEEKTAEKEKTIKKSREKESAKQLELDEERIVSNSAVEKAIEEYDAYLAGDNKNGGLMLYETKTRVDRRVRELEGNINGKQQAYNNRKQEVDKLPFGLDCEAAYQRRRGKIWIDDLQGIQQKLKEQTYTYEKIFKREFVLNIYNTAKDAKDDISDINKELRKLQFSTKYQFDVKLLSDNSDYAKILRYAEYLQETNSMSDGQMTLTSLMGYENDEVEAREKEIRDIIN